MERRRYRGHRDVSPGRRSGISALSRPGSSSVVLVRDVFLGGVVIRSVICRGVQSVVGCMHVSHEGGIPMGAPEYAIAIRVGAGQREVSPSPTVVLENDPLRQNYFPAHFRDINGMKRLHFLCRLSLYRV